MKTGIFIGKYTTISFINIKEGCPVTRVQTAVINCIFLLFMIMIYIQANYSTFQY